MCTVTFSMMNEHSIKNKAYIGNCQKWNVFSEANKTRGGCFAALGSLEIAQLSHFVTRAPEHWQNLVGCLGGITAVNSTYWVPRGCDSALTRRNMSTDGTGHSLPTIYVTFQLSQTWIQKSFPLGSWTKFNLCPYFNVRLTNNCTHQHGDIMRAQTDR